MWTISPTAITHRDTAAVLRDCMAELAGRYYGRAATGEEIDKALADEPVAGLVPPTGLFLLARDVGKVSGCVGVRLLEPGTAELTKLFVYPVARGRGGATRLLDAAEQAARELGAEVMRLNTRSDLVEAKRLYARHGYAEIEPYTTGRYVDHCFEKVLRRPEARHSPGEVPGDRVQPAATCAPQV